MEKEWSNFWELFALFARSLQQKYDYEASAFIYFILQYIERYANLA